MIVANSARRERTGAGDHDEVVSPSGAEASEGFAEATLAELVAESAEESAVSDLVEEGYAPSTVEEVAAVSQEEAVEEVGTALDEEPATKAASIIELVLGSDDRVRIQNTQNEPWRLICTLWITFKTGRRYRATGFLIGPGTVATAGHCVYLANEGGWAREIEVIPGANGTQRPYGSAKSSSFRSVAGWVRDEKRASDYGCIILPTGSFPDLGHLVISALETDALKAAPVVVAGYPGDKPPGQLWGMGRRLKAITPTRLMYDIDTMGGQSGAPVYLKVGGNRRVCGIHDHGGSRGNTAMRITEAVYKNLEAWSRSALR
jgi:glutamyl endopeptidase